MSGHLVVGIVASCCSVGARRGDGAWWRDRSGPIPIGGGFWALGIESIRLLTNSEFEPLVDLAKKRLEPQLVETEPPSALINH